MSAYFNHEFEVKYVQDVTFTLLCGELLEKWIKEKLKRNCREFFQEKDEILQNYFSDLCWLVILYEEEYHLLVNYSR